MFRNKSLIILAALSSIALTSCGSSLSDLDYIKNKGEFVLGFTDFPPMGFSDRGVVTGFDIELAAAVTEKMDVKLVTRYIDWDAKVLELNSKRIDAVWNGFTITGERKQEVTFSKPYFANN